MSVSDDSTLEDVLESDELESLGEPSVQDGPDSTDTAWNVEFRRYLDPELESVASNAYVIASDLTTSLSLFDNVEDIQEKAWQQALNLKHQLAGSEEENPVFVSGDIIELLGGDDRATAHIRFKGDRFMYPVTLRSKDELVKRLEGMDVVSAEALEDTDIKEEDIEEKMDEWRKDYLDKIDSQAVSNRFLVPVFAYEDSGIPSTVSAASLRTPDSEVLADPNLKIEDYVQGENELENASVFPEITADVVESEEGYSLLLDISSLDTTSLEAYIEDDGLVVYDGEEEIYRFSVEEHLEEPVDTIEYAEERNGVYNLELG